MDLELGFGKQTISATIPDRNLMGVLSPNTPDQPRPPEELIREALQHPIGTPRLRELVRPGEKIVIVTSDITRPMPTKTVLPLLMEELAAAGIKDEDIEIVFGLGSHRSHTEAEMRGLVGDAMFQRLRCTDSNSGRYISVGTTPGNGTPVEVFETVLNADRRICLGNIEFHYLAGYSGGGKAIMPAVCSRDSIQRNHSLMLREESRAGEMERNPFRQDIEEAAEMVGIDFILNVALDEHKTVIGAVCGHHVKAHRKGAMLLDAVYKAKLDAPADIVLVSPGGYPKDINLYQAQKALDNAKHAVRDGGIIILAASCAEGLGEKVFQRWMTEAESPGQLIQRIRERFVLGGHKAAAIALTLERVRIFLVSDLNPEFVRDIFLEPYPSVEEAISSALSALGDDSQILVMPYGGSTLPAVQP